MAYTPNYSKDSPYYYTPIIGRFMDLYIHRNIPEHEYDSPYILDNYRYVNRPDLFSLDLYGTVELFWVVPVRSKLKDPIFDFRIGQFLWIPHPLYVRTLI